MKEREIETVLADNNLNAVARSYADKFNKVDILNAEAVKKVVIEEQLDFIITAAKASEELNLPCYIAYKMACDVSDKGKKKII